MARRTTGRVTVPGAAVVVLVIAAGLALPDGDPGPDTCRGVTRALTPPVVALAGLKGCGELPDLAGRGGVRYDRKAGCFVFQSEGGLPALLVWPDGTRPLAGPVPSVLVPDRSRPGHDHPGGTVTSGDTVEGVGPVLPAGGVDRVSAGCRAVVGDAVVAFAGLRVVRGEEGPS